MKPRTLNEYRQTKDSVYRVPTNITNNYSKDEPLDEVKLFVWTDKSPSKTLINLNSEELQIAVSSGHDNNWGDNVDEINHNILEGRECGITQIERYSGAVKDVVYWELSKSFFTQEDMSELIDLIRKTPNDWNLGQKIREYFIKKTLV
jgi:hypothetical protein